MWANSVWSLFGLAVTLVLTVLSLPPNYAWLQPWFLGAAFLSGLASLVTLVWPAIRLRGTIKDNLIEQPDIVLLSPKRTYTLKWDPPYSMQIVLWPNSVPNIPDQVSGLFPAVYIKNIGKSVAYQILIEWRIENMSDAELIRSIKASSLMREFNVTVSGNNFIVSGRTDDQNSSMWAERFLCSDTTRIEFLAPTMDNNAGQEITLPHDISAWIDIYFTSVFERHPFMSSASLTLTAEVTWERPVFKQPASFRLTMKCLRARSDNALIAIEGTNEFRPAPRVEGLVTVRVAPA